MINKDEIKELIELFVPNITDSGSKLIIEGRGQNVDSNKWEIDNEKLDNICEELNSKDFKEATIYDQKSYETLLNPFNRHSLRLMNETISIIDKENNINYEP